MLRDKLLIVEVVGVGQLSLGHLLSCLLLLLLLLVTLEKRAHASLIACCGICLLHDACKLMSHHVWNVVQTWYAIWHFLHSYEWILTCHCIKGISALICLHSGHAGKWSRKVKKLRIILTTLAHGEHTVAKLICICSKLEVGASSKVIEDVVTVLENRSVHVEVRARLV